MNWEPIILLAIVFSAIGLLPVVVVIGVRHARAKQPPFKYSNKSGGAYADIEDVIASERERIERRQVCSDKTHWH